jgi:hypothetical protein
LGGRARWRGNRDRRPFAHACPGDVDRSNSPALVSIGSQGGTMLAIAGTGYGLIGLLVIILLVVLIVYFVRRA